MEWCLYDMVDYHSNNLSNWLELRKCDFNQVHLINWYRQCKEYQIYINIYNHACHDWLSFPDINNVSSVRKHKIHLTFIYQGPANLQTFFRLYRFSCTKKKFHGVNMAIFVIHMVNNKYIIIYIYLYQTNNIRFFQYCTLGKVSLYFLSKYFPESVCRPLINTRCGLLYNFYIFQTFLFYIFL